MCREKLCNYSRQYYQTHREEACQYYEIHREEICESDAHSYTVDFYMNDIKKGLNLCVH